MALLPQRCPRVTLCLRIRLSRRLGRCRVFPTWPVLLLRCAGVGPRKVTEGSRLFDKLPVCASHEWIALQFCFLKVHDYAAGKLCASKFYARFRALVKLEAPKHHRNEAAADKVRQHDDPDCTRIHARYAESIHRSLRSSWIKRIVITVAKPWIDPANHITMLS